MILSFDEDGSSMEIDRANKDSMNQVLNARIMNGLMNELDEEELTQRFTQALMNAPPERPQSEEEEVYNVDGRAPIDKTYVHFDTDTYVLTRQLFRRTFLVTAEREPQPWRLTEEEKVFLGYRVLKATADFEGVALEAWYTPDLNIPAGPELYGGLPGIILNLSVGGDSLSYTARDVNLSANVKVDRPMDDHVVSGRSRGNCYREDQGI